MLQSYFDYPLEERFTWYSNDGFTKHVLDYILAESFVQQYAEDCKVLPNLEFNTDHKLLTAFFNTPKTKKARWKPKNLNKLCQPKNLEALKYINIQNSFLQKISNQQMPYGEEHNVNQHSKTIVSVLEKAALE